MLLFGFAKLWLCACNRVAKLMNNAASCRNEVVFVGKKKPEVLLFVHKEPSGQ